MYSKNFCLLFVANTLCAAMLMISESYAINNSEAVEQAEETVVEIQEKYEVSAEKRESFQRIIQVEDLQPSYCIEASEKDVDTLMKIVEAEAGHEDRTGKLLVADVVINRVKNKSFPDSITGVVYQKSQNITQFSPVANGTINKVNISNETREVVYSALRGEDVSKGALYFMARKYAEPENVKWFDNNLTFLFSYGGHAFYTQ